jgi:Pyridoxamine 5'-phosphate oxidase
VSGDQSFDLRSMEGCFDGTVPPVIATCSKDGIPHATYLSQLNLVDEEHLALSNQFWTRTTANLLDNPRASVLVSDSQTYETYRLALSFERRDTDGPIFERLRVSIEAIAKMMSMEEIFSLRSADVYRVLSCDRIAGPSPPR